MTGGPGNWVLAAVFVFLPYAALAVLLAGATFRLVQWLKTPSSEVPGLYPQPGTKAQAWTRLVLELAGFAPLGGGNRLHRFLTVLFHAALLLVFFRHLRWFIQPVPDWMVSWQWIGRAAGLVFPAAVLVLLLPRLAWPPLAMVSRFSDLVGLVLLLALGLSGLALAYLDRVDLVSVKHWGLGLWRLDPAIPESSELLVIHSALGLAAAFWFAWFKIGHVPAAFLAKAERMGLWRRS